MRRGTSPSAAFGDLMKLVDRMSAVPARTAALAAPKLDRLVAAQFRQGVDPYGRAWAPLRPATLALGRHPPPLTDTGAMRDGIGVRVNPGRRAGLRLVVGAPYARFHQTGTRYMAARRIAPQFGMPQAWRAVLRAASKQAGQEALLAGREVV